MLLFELLLVVFSLNVIQSELYESKPGELSEAASNVKAYLVSLDDIDNSNIRNIVIKRNVSNVAEQEYSAGKSMRVQSEHFRHLPSGLSRARRPLGPRGQKRNGIIGIIARIGRIIRIGRKGRFPGRKGRSRGRLTSKGRKDRQGSRRKDRKRKNQSVASDPGLLEETVEEDPAKETMDPDYDYDFSGETVYYSK